jgi:hypothetical protein
MVPVKVQEKVPGSFGEKPSQFQRVSEKAPEKVPEKVREKVPGVFGGFRRRFRRRSGRLWCRARSGSTGSTGHQGFQRWASQHA